MKLAVVFPGIGYHTDKPLLYYAKKLAKAYGYEVVEVPYGNFPQNVKGSPEKMREAFYSALEQTREMLKDVRWKDYDNLLFISKSIGTAIAAAYAGEQGLTTCNLFYTPVEETFPFVKQEGIVFHGTKDAWVEMDVVVNACREKGLPLYITENANHSLETGEVMTDITNLHLIMEKSREYIESIAEVQHGRK